MKKSTLAIMVCHYSASLVMPNCDPRDGVFHPTLTLVKDYYLIQQVSGMDEIEKIEKGVASICKGDDKRNDIMMLMNKEASWDQFLTPAPYAIAILGELILISADTDFSLEDKPPKDGFQLLRYPNSFRASLVQVSHSGWEAFNEAHTSMDQIKLHSANVDTHVKNAVKFLLKGSPQEVEHMLPLCLKKIKKISDESLSLAKNIEGRFVTTMKLIAELLEACTNTKGIYESKIKETAAAIRVAKCEEGAAKKEKEAMDQRLKTMEKDVKEAQNDFKDAVSSMPTASDILQLSLVDSMVEGVRAITNIPSTFKSVVKTGVKGIASIAARPYHMIAQSSKGHSMKVSMGVGMDIDMDSDEEEDSGVVDNKTMDVRLSENKIYAQVEKMNESINQLAYLIWGNGDEKCPEPNTSEIVKGSRLTEIKFMLQQCWDHVNRENKSRNLQKKVMEICKNGITICKEMVALTRSMSASSDHKILRLSKEVGALLCLSEPLAVKARVKLDKNPLDNKPPHLAKMPTQSRSKSMAIAAREEARFKVDLAKETLKDARNRQDKAYEEMKVSNERLTKVLKELEMLDYQKIDFDTIRETLVKGIQALAEVRAEWGKMVRFFQMLSNLVKCCLNASLEDFVDSSKEGHSLTLGGTPLSNVFKDLIFEQATQANKVAFVVHTIAKTYTQVSEKYLMDRVNSLDKLIALDPQKDGHKIRKERMALHNGCTQAQEAIKVMVMEEKENFHSRIDARIARIEREVGALIPPLPPAREKQMKKSIEHGLTMSDKDVEDLV